MDTDSQYRFASAEVSECFCLHFFIIFLHLLQCILSRIAFPVACEYADQRLRLQFIPTCRRDIVSTSMPIFSVDIKLLGLLPRTLEIPFKSSRRFTTPTSFELSLLEQMTNANVTVNTVIENTVNNQRKQHKHPGIKEDLHSLFRHIGSV